MKTPLTYADAVDLWMKAPSNIEKPLSYDVAVLLMKVQAQQALISRAHLAISDMHEQGQDCCECQEGGHCPLGLDLANALGRIPVRSDTCATCGEPMLYRVDAGRVVASFCGSMTSCAAALMEIPE